MMWARLMALEGIAFGAQGDYTAQIGVLRKVLEIDSR